MLAHGVRTVVDLRNDEERGPDTAPRPREITTLHVPLDGWDDREFWDVWGSGPQFGTPLYYGPHLERHADRSAAAIRAIATAPPGGVAFHCQGGRDRSGQVAMLALALAGVPAHHIAADYARSGPALKASFAARGAKDDGPKLAAYLAEQGTTAQQVIEELLASTDVEQTLRAGGLEPEAIAALRGRLSHPSTVASIVSAPRARATDDAVVPVADRVAVADRDQRDRRQRRAAVLGEPDALPPLARDRGGAEVAVELLGTARLERAADAAQRDLGDPGPPPARRDRALVEHGQARRTPRAARRSRRAMRRAAAGAGCAPERALCVDEAGAGLEHAPDTAPETAPPHREDGADPAPDPLPPRHGPPRYPCRDRRRG